MNFNSPILFPWWPKQTIFFTRCLYFHHNWWKKEEQQWTLQIFLKDVTEGKTVEIHKHG